jgi:3-oxoacid CoA-transferase subunit A
MAGRTTIAEVERLVNPGAVDPARVDTPGVFVQRVVVTDHGKPIEKLTTRPRTTGSIRDDT